MTVEVTSDTWGRRAILRTPWTDSEAAQLLASGIARVHVIGFAQQPVPPLSNLQGIAELKVLTLDVTSDASVTQLSELTALSLETHARNPIDFRVFKRLQRLHVNWRPSAETAFENPSIRSLSVSRYPFADLRPLRRLGRLQGLRIANARTLTSLVGIADLPALKRLWLIDDRALTNIDGLATGRPALVDLLMNVCREVGTLDALGGQLSLESLSLLEGGRIASLRPLVALPRLRRLRFHGTTIEDGDLSVLLAMPALAVVAFGNRPHYSHDLASVEDVLRRRHGAPEQEPQPHWWW
jgi:hypothetical protein